MSPVLHPSTPEKSQNSPISHPAGCQHTVDQHGPDCGPRSTRHAAACPDVRAWRRHVQRLIDTEKRSDKRAHLESIADALVAAFRDAEGLARITNPGLERWVGIGERSIRRLLHWFYTNGLLQVVEAGTLPQWRRRGSLPGCSLPHGRQLTLTLPAPAPPAAPRNVRPTGNSLPLVENQPLSAREEPPTAAPRPGQRPAWGIQSRDITRSKRQRIHLAQRLIAESGPTLRRASAPAVASVLRPWLAAGWTLADVRWALDHAPDGAHHWYSESVRDPIGWLRHRLADWTDGSGAPLPPAGGYQRAKDASRTSRLASAEHSRQQDERQREEARRALANASPEVRQMLEAARRRRALRPGRQHSLARPGPSPVSECQHGNPIGGCWHWRCR